jgi:CHASE3 domain sensor protein
MSAEPGAEQELTQEPEATAAWATKQYVDGSIRFAELRIKKEFETENSKALAIVKETIGRAVENTIRELKSDLKSAELEQEREESRKKTERSMEWLNRFLAGLIGFVICMFFGIAVQQCSQLGDRMSTLESKEAKK